MGGNSGVFVAVAVDVACCLVAQEEAELYNLLFFSRRAILSKQY